MTTKPTDSQKLELLYKKYLGYPDAYPGTVPSVEAPGSARQKVFSSLQILAQTVPSTAPTGLIVDNTFAGGSNIRYTNTTYPYIVKYNKLPLTSVKPNTSFTYSYTGLPNLLTNVIPTNFDAIGSYVIYVYKNNIQVSPDIWVLDVDAGYITFFDANVIENVTISFWRYEGIVGLDNLVGGIITPDKGGTGVNNGTNTITLGGNLTTSGAYNTTLTTTGTTSVTLPTSGTLVSTTGLTSGSIPYADVNGNLTQNNSGLYYSGTTLGINNLDTSNYLTLIDNAVSIWTYKSTTSTSIINSICWSPELKLFVAAASTSPSSAGNILISTDSINWNYITSITTQTFSICWSPKLSLFIAGGYSNSIFISSNGISWSLSSSVVSGDPIGICWSEKLNIFVTITSSYLIYTSSNGINWTIRTVSNSTGIRKICWSDELGLFCSVGATKVITSSNGINWNIISISNNENDYYQDVCWSSELGLFCAVGINIIMTSNNGTNWVRNTSYNIDLRGVSWSSELGLFCAVGVNIIMTSSNGNVWNSKGSISNTNFECVCWSCELGIFVAGGLNNQNLYNPIITSTPLIGKYYYDPVYNNKSSLIQINSTNKGLLLPSLNKSQLNTIVSPQKGLLIYNIEDNSIKLNSGYSWRDIVSKSPDGNLYLTGNVGVDISPQAKLHISQTGTSDSFRVDDEANDTTPFIIKSDGIVGIGTSSPNSSSILDLTSTTKGFLPPRMSTNNITNITTPADGLTVYNTGKKCLSVYNSSTTSWNDIAIQGANVASTQISGVISPTNGGTGVNNGTNTITLGGNLTTSGAFNTTLTTTAGTNVTLPASGTLISSTSTVDIRNLASANWSVAVTQSLSNWLYATSYTVNGGNSENSIEYGLDPYDRPAILWECRNNDVTVNQDGGWNIEFPASETKNYISIIYLKRVGTSTSGVFRHGCSLTNTNDMNNTQNTDPYFILNYQLSLLPQDVWCISIGLIYALDHSSTTPSSLGGIYRLDTGVKLTSNTSFKMRIGATTQRQRVYMFNSNDPGVVLQFWSPQFYEVNGNELPSIQNIIPVSASRMPALTGDVTTTVGTVATTISNGSVSLGKMAQLPANTIIGNNTASSATPLALSADNVKSMVGLAITSGAIPFGNSASTGVDVDSTNLSFNNDTNTLNVQNVTASGNVGIGTNTPNSSAILDITSTTKGFLPPRMTTAQINGIASPAEGLIAYNTTEKTISYRDNIAWRDAITKDCRNLASNKWTVGATQTLANWYYATAFDNIGSTIENDIEYGLDPYNRPATLWSCKNKDETTPNTGDGGWILTIPVNENRNYVSIVYVKRVGSPNSGTFYHGCGYDPMSTTMDKANPGNAYFAEFGISSLPQDVWCVSIGLIYGSSHTATTDSSFGGIYRLDTGVRLSTPPSFKMKLGTTIQMHRAFLYYSNPDNNGVILQMWNPQFYEINGNEASLITEFNSVKTNYLGNVGIGTASPNSSAILDLTSTTKGFLPPRTTTSSITSPVEGLTIYDTGRKCLSVYKPSRWTDIGKVKIVLVSNVNYIISDPSDTHIVYTSVSASRTITLPSPDSRYGEIISVKDGSGSLNQLASTSIVLTISSPDSTIDGKSTFDMNYPYQRVELMSIGTAWSIVNSYVRDNYVIAAQVRAYVSFNFNSDTGTLYTHISVGASVFTPFLSDPNEESTTFGITLKNTAPDDRYCISANAASATNLNAAITDVVNISVYAKTTSSFRFKTVDETNNSRISPTFYCTVAIIY